MKKKLNPKKPYEGIEKILDEKRHKSPLHELWAVTILNAMCNVNLKSGDWEKDLQFLAGWGNWELACQFLEIDPKRSSKLALKNFYKIDQDFKKHYWEGSR